MSKPACDEKEARERMTEDMRKSGCNKKWAEKEADASVGRVLDTLARKAGMSAAEQARTPRDPR